MFNVWLNIRSSSGLSMSVPDNVSVLYCIESEPGGVTLFSFLDFPLFSARFYLFLQLIRRL